MHQDAKAAAAAAAAAVQGLPDLGRRYLDFIAQALGQGHDAAAAAVTAPFCHGGLPRFSGGHPDNFFIDVSVRERERERARERQGRIRAQFAAVFCLVTLYRDIAGKLL